MSLGCFSVSLSVKDITKSIAFYKTLGFTMFHDASADGWCILKNDTAIIGLFHGMFEGNLLTFNPGWAGEGQPLDQFEDIRDIQARLLAGGIAPATPLDPEGTGPGEFTVTDPDGNVILIDQHVDRPAG